MSDTVLEEASGPAATNDAGLMPDRCPPANGSNREKAGPGSSAQERFLNREAAEVYLLLDFLSGRTDKSLRPTYDEQVQALHVAPVERGGLSLGSGNQSEDVADLCVDINAALNEPCRLLIRVLQIKYPIEYEPKRFAPDGAFLVRARDILNGRAAPASGATIAFTTLVAGAKALSGSRKDVVRGADGTGPPRGLADGAVPEPHFAEIAYPRLRRDARRLYSQIRRCRLTALFVLLAALALSAYTTWGKSILDSMDAVRRDAKSIEEQISAAGSPKPCDDLNRTSVLCKQKEIDKRFDITTHHLATWAFLRPVCIPPLDRTRATPDFWCWVLSARTEGNPATDATDAENTFAIERMRIVEWATAFLAVLGNYILPSLYGWLGALAFVLRQFNARLADSLLTDRDRTANTVRLVLGAAIGSSIGLVYSDSSLAQLSGVLGQAVTLSTASIAFFAGYGVEAVFKMFDSLIKHVFQVGAGQDAPTRAAR